VYCYNFSITIKVQTWEQQHGILRFKLREVFMKVLGKPKNKWGWVRVSGWAVMAGVVVWTVVAAALRGMGGVPWLAWSGYQLFSLLDGIELAVVPLLAVFIGGWLEEENFRTETEQSNQAESERVSAEQRKTIIKHYHDAILSELPETRHGKAEITEHNRLRMKEIVWAALPQLDGKGKGEFLHFLFEKGLLSGEKPVIELTGMDFGGVILHKAHLNNIYLEGCDLTAAQLDGAHLVKGRLSMAKLKKAALRHADLREAVLVRSNLSGAHLENANLEGADIKAACLEGAFLTKANLKHCKLTGIQVKDAFFQQADLRGCQGFNLAILDQAILIETIFPDGRKVTNEKGKAYLQKKEIAAVIDRL
jgi:hypothetical protein